MTSEPESSGEPSPRTNDGRGVARLAAVQAIYQMDLTQRDLAEVLAEFTVHRFESGGAEIYTGADVDFFRSLVTETVMRQADIDQEISAHLADGWRLARLDSSLRAILRAGANEIVSRPDVPARVTINEYVNIAHAFFSGDEPGVVNGVLDRVARKRREGEFAKRKAVRKSD